MIMYCFFIGVWKNFLDIFYDFFVLGFRDCLVKIWNMKEGFGVVVVICYGYNGFVNCVSFGDNLFLVFVLEDCFVRIWRISIV